jgi:hypothetical protein
MAQSDLTIQNQSFPSFRADLNDALTALNSMQSGTSRPASAVAGTMWLDTTNATNPTIKFFDGTDDITFATVDYSANTINFSDSATDLLGDTTPQLGGMLDVNGQAIGNGTEELIKFLETASAVNEITITNADTTNAPEISATGDDTDIDLKLTPKGAGNLVLDGIKFPNADGTANQVLQTDGSGVLSFATVSGGFAWQSVQTTDFTASAGNAYPCDTSYDGFTVTLPATPSAGDQVQLVDYAGTFDTDALTINPNGEDIEGGASSLQLKGEREGVILTYIDSTQGWIATSGINEGTDALEPVSYSVDFLVIAGGGAGGNNFADGGNSSGGGGAGGYRNSFSTETSGGGGSSESSLTFVGGTVYTITVGAGAGTNSTNNARGGNGNNSEISGSGISTITSSGGGGGGGNSNNTGVSGGSGGGGSATGSGGTGTANQGFNGGSASSNGGAGGGGASAVGANTTSVNGSNGGAGLASSITGSSVSRAGGGGGGGAGSLVGGGNKGIGGTGGGGNGSEHPSTSATAGSINTGSGGGGGNSNDSIASGGAGGKGVVILRMPDASYSGTTTGSPTVNTNVGGSGETVIIFNDSGSITG